MVNLNKFNTSKPEIIVQTYINPSEDTNKVSFAMKNIFPNSEIKLKENKLYFSSERFEELRKIREQIKSKATFAVLKKVLFNNQKMNKTSFLLNKQAAFSGIVAIVEEEEESPLGPIKIIIKNKDIEEIIKWFES
jgi:predicted RNA binding protein with dsRBD fold (UPF0201 family)